MLTPKEKEKLHKKMVAFKENQRSEREKFIKDRRLDKEGEPQWEKYTRRVIATYDRFQRTDYHKALTMYKNALYNLRKGKVSPNIDI